MSAPAAAPAFLEAELLALVPGCEDGRAAFAVERLAGGSVNRTLLVHSAEGRFVLRISGDLAARLGVNRRREAAFQALAATAGLAPRIVRASLDARVLVAEYVPGRVWTAADLRDPAALERLGERLEALRSLAVPAELATPRFDALREARRLAGEALAAGDAPGLIERILEEAARALAAGGGRRAAAVLHLDLHPQNLVEGDRVVLLDWEYAAWGDPALELASLAATGLVPEAQLDRLRAAAGLAGSVGGAELAALQRVFEATHWLWYRARRLKGPPTPAEGAAESALFERLNGGM